MGSEAFKFQKHDFKITDFTTGLKVLPSWPNFVWALSPKNLWCPVATTPIFLQKEAQRIKIKKKTYNYIACVNFNRDSPKIYFKIYLLGLQFSTWSLETWQLCSKD